MTCDSITLETLAKNAEPYDPSVAEKDKLLEIIKGKEEFERQFEEKITPDFIKRINEVGKCYFIINYVSYKQKIFSTKGELRLSYCGKSRDPVISVDI